MSRVRIPSPAPTRDGGSGGDGNQAHVAQSAERVLGKDEVTSSILVVGSSSASGGNANGYGAWQEYRGESMAKEKFDRVEAAREHRDDRARGPREDVADGGDHEGAGGDEPEGSVQGLRPDRQRARGAGARGHDQRVARGVRDGEPSLRARGLPGSRGLHQEHDHGRGADGRVDPGGVGGGRADAADAGAHPAGAAGRGSVASWCS